VFVSIDYVQRPQEIESFKYLCVIISIEEVKTTSRKTIPQSWCLLRRLPKQQNPFET